MKITETRPVVKPQSKLSIWQKIGRFFAKIFGFILSKIAEFLKKIGRLGELLCKALSRFGVKTTPAEIERTGAKALSENAPSPNEFKTTSEYYEKLQTIKFDDSHKKILETKPEQCQATGYSITHKLLEEKSHMKIPGEFDFAAEKTNISNITGSLIEKFHAAGFESMQTFVDFLDKKLDDVKQNKVYGILLEAIREENPELQMPDIQEQIATIQSNYEKPEPSEAELEKDWTEEQRKRIEELKKEGISI